MAALGIPCAAVADRAPKARPVLQEGRAKMGRRANQERQAKTGQTVSRAGCWAIKCAGSFDVAAPPPAQAPKLEL